MSEIQLVKKDGALWPAYQSDKEAFEKIREGVALNASVKQPRNPQFHRKMFALLNLGFDYWEPEEIDGIAAEKNFDRFRKDVLILAGHRRVVVNIKNEPRYEAESISFAKMDETEFNSVYKGVFSVIWKLVLSSVMSEDEANAAVEELMSYS